LPLLTSAALAIPNIFNASDLLTSAGPLALVVVIVFVFIETGLLFPFLPGDSLVFTCALLSTSLGLPLPWLIVAAAGAAIAGDQVGYLIGRRLGPRLFKPKAKIFKSKYRDQANAFFDRYGAGALVLARFVPLLRTFVPPIAGSSTLHYRRFLIWNVSGGIAWAVLLCIAGFWLGRIPFVADNIELIAVVIVIVSVLPIGIGLLRRRITARKQRRLDPAVNQ
jgi:membrane-associated protein